MNKKMNNQYKYSNGFRKGYELLRRLLILVMTAFMMLTSIDVNAIAVFAEENPDETDIFGFSGEKTEEENQETVEEKSEEEKSEEQKSEEENSSTEAVTETEEDGLVQQTVKATMTTDPETAVPSKAPKKAARGKFATPKSAGPEINLTGLLPEGAEVEAYPVTVSIPGEKVLAAYDITIYVPVLDEEGNATGEREVWQPKDSVNVSIADAALKDASDVQIYHMDNKNAEPEIVEITTAEEGVVQFDADKFSVYAITKTILIKTIATPEGLNYKITVTYDSESGLPSEEDGAALNVQLKDTKDYQQKVEKATGNENAKLLNAFDISIVDGNGKKQQPTKDVTVSITLEGKSGYSNPQIVHIPDGLFASPEAIVPEVDGNTLTFNTDGFSVYVVEDESDMDIYKFQTVDGNLYDQQAIAAGDTLVKPTTPVIEGKTFLGWYQVIDGTVQDTPFEGFGVINSVQPGAEIILRAQYDNRIYITYYDQEGTVLRMDNAAEVTITEGENAGKVDPDLVRYAPIDKDGVSYDWKGWAETQNANESAKVGPFEPTADKSLYPILVAGQWINYHSNAIGSGATYTEPTFVRASSAPVAPTSPTRNGYTFAGWWTSSDDTGVEVFAADGTLNPAYRRLTESLDLYAHWTAGTVEYTIAYYAQKSTCEAGVDPVADDDYVFLKVKGTATATAGSNVSRADLGMNETQILNDAFTSDTSSTYANDRKGFQLSTVNNPSVTVDGNGTSVLKVYLDRKTFTISLTYPTYCTWISGNYYYRTNEYSAKFPNGEDANAITALYGSKIYSYFPVKFTARSTHRSSNGNYWQNNTSSTVTDATVSWQDVSTSPYFSAVLASTDEMPPQDVTFQYASVLGSNKTAFYYFELADNDPDFNASTNGPKVTVNNRTVNKYVEIDGKKYICDPARTLIHSYNYLTKGEEFYKVNGFDQAFGDPDFIYVYRNGQVVNVGRADGNRTQGGNNETLYKLYYDRQTFDIVLKYGSNAGNYAGRNIDTIHDVKFDQTVSKSDMLASYENSLPTMEGHRFTGWYMDEACTVPAFGDDGKFQMPANSLILYAGYELIEYQITLDPDGGELSSGASTWFKIEYGDTFSEYTPTRHYAKVDGGEYTYVLYSFNPEDPKNLENRPRTAYYYVEGEVPTVPQAEIDSGITRMESGYAPERNAYSFVGWYKQKDDGTLESTSYNFNQPVRGDVHLVAKWQPNIVYKVQYALEDSNGEELTGIGGVSAPEDNQTYAGESRAQVMDLVDSDKLAYGKQFRGWKIKGGDDTVYAPGESFVISDEDAVRITDPVSGSVSRVITLIPEIEESAPAHQTSGTYIFMNWVEPRDTGDGNGSCLRNEDDGTPILDVDGNIRTEAGWVTFYEEIVYSNESLTEPPAVPHRNGDPNDSGEFQGWFEDETLVTRFDGFGIIKNPEPVKYLYASFLKPIHVYYYTAVEDGQEGERKILNVQNYRADGQGNLDTTGVGTEYIYSSVYNLCGWSEVKLPLGTTSQDGVTVYPFNAPTSNKKVSEDMHLYPVMESGYTLSFDTMGGSPIQSKFYATGTSTVEPTDPSKGGYDDSRPAGKKNEYTFAGWYTDTTYSTPFTFGNPLTESTMIYAKWTNNWDPEQAKATVVYWVQNSDGNTYSVPENGTVAVEQTPRTEYTLDETTRNNKFTTLVSPNANYYELDRMDLKDSNGQRTVNSGDATIMVDADSSATINVYYKLKRYNLTFNAVNGDVNGTVNKNNEATYNFETYLGMDVTNLWPSANPNNDAKAFEGWYNGSTKINTPTEVTAQMLDLQNFIAHYSDKETSANNTWYGDNNAPTEKQQKIVVNYHLGGDVITEEKYINYSDYNGTYLPAHNAYASNSSNTAQLNALSDRKDFDGYSFEEASSASTKEGGDVTKQTQYKYSFRNGVATYYADHARTPDVLGYFHYYYHPITLDGNWTTGGPVFMANGSVFTGTAMRATRNERTPTKVARAELNKPAEVTGDYILSESNASSDGYYQGVSYSDFSNPTGSYINRQQREANVFTPGTLTIDYYYTKDGTPEHSLTLKLTTANGDDIKDKLNENYAEGADISNALSTTINAAEKALLIPDGAEEEDYTFLGWSLYNDHYVPYAESTMPDHDLTLYAYVAPKQVSVTTLVKQNAPETRSRDVYTQFGGFDIPTPRTEEGERFLGWRDEETGEYWEYNMPVNRDVTVRAMFQDNNSKFYIHYDLGDGTVVISPPITGVEADRVGESYFDSQSGDVTVPDGNKRWKDPTGYAPGAKIPALTFTANSEGNNGVTVKSPSGYNQFIYWQDAKGKIYRVNDMITVPQDGDITLYAVYSRWLETTLVYQVNASPLTYEDKTVVFKDYRDPNRDENELFTNQTYPLGTHYAENSETNKYEYMVWTWEMNGEQKGIELLNPGYTFRGWLDSTKSEQYEAAGEDDKDGLLYQNNLTIRVTPPDLDENGNPIINYMVAQWKQDKLPVETWKRPNGGTDEKYDAGCGDMTTTEVHTWTSDEFLTAYKALVSYTDPTGFSFDHMEVNGTTVTGVKYDEKEDHSGYEWAYTTDGTNYTAFDAGVVLKLIYVDNIKLTVTKTVDGQMGETTRDFEFYVTVEGAEEGKQFDSTKTHTDSTTTDEKLTLTNGKVSFTLKHGETIEITLPLGKVTSISETSVTGYTTKMALNSSVGILTPEISDNNGVKTLTFSEALKNNSTVNVLNYHGDIAPTGVSMVILPFIIILVAGAALFLLNHRKREN